jgi:hypothetical protein
MATAIRARKTSGKRQTKSANPFLGASLARYVRNVQGHRVELELVEVDPQNVRLDTTNPRLRYSMLQLDEAERSDAACVLLLTSQEETESLKRSIQLSGGVQEPIYVRADGVVAEGNRRVVALRALAEEHPSNEAFRAMPAWKIPTATSEAQVQDLLNEIHLGSVRGWAPYEKGAQMRALVRNGYSEDEIGERYRMTGTDVRNHISAVDFMEKTYFPITKDPADPNHRSKFSYFLEFFKNGRLRDHAEAIPDLPERFARWVRDERIDTGARVRRLAKILESEQATRLLEISGFQAAEECLAKENPHEQELYALMEQARARLEGMTVNEMMELRESPERLQLLAALRDAAGERLSIAARIKKKR